MSEYQYYEFQAIDRPLTPEDQAALRAISTRARITAASFTNSYEWGDFKGDPGKLMSQWFDLHLYLANWGTRVLMIRFPAQMVDSDDLRTLVEASDDARLERTGKHLLLEIWRDEIETSEDWDDGSGWLAALAPLRADVLSGDLRLFYLLWLMAAQHGNVADDALEPSPGLGPLTSALEAFARFFAVDPDLVAAAAEQSDDTLAPAAPDTISRAIDSLSEDDRNRMLIRLFEGDPHVVNEGRALLRKMRNTDPVSPRRTLKDLRTRAAAVRAERAREEARLRETERLRKATQAERARRSRLDAIERRGASVWQEIESEIERRNAPSYDRAAQLLRDLKVISQEQATQESFRNRLEDIRARHAKKQKFLERLRGL